MSSYLIIGASKQKRQEEIARMSHRYQVSRFDQINLTEGRIDQIRQLQHQLQLKSYSSKVRLAVIDQAEKLTIPAQNALLKLLEEPPANAMIILASPTADLLLPTVVSRCQIIKLRTGPDRPDQETYNSGLIILNSILKSGVGERLKIAGEIASTREKAMEFCQNQLFIWRDKIKKTPVKHHIQTIRQIQRALHFLEANVNPKLVIENLLCHYPPPVRSRIVLGRTNQENSLKIQELGALSALIFFDNLF